MSFAFIEGENQLHRMALPPTRNKRGFPPLVNQCGRQDAKFEVAQQASCEVLALIDAAADS